MQNYNHPVQITNPITQVAELPNPLFLSLQGGYFVGYADEMEFDSKTIAWAGLVNPVNSGVTLHVYVWTVTNVGQVPLTAEVWLNSEPVGCPFHSEFVTSANTAICPLPKAKTLLLQANQVPVEQLEGFKLTERTVEPEVTVASDEDGIFIFPPGGSIIITLSYRESTENLGLGRVAFGWSEEEIDCDLKGGSIYD